MALAAALSRYESLVTGRDHSLFGADVEDHRELLSERLRQGRVAILGAAGSIGSSVVREILRYAPRSLVLFDLSENDLVELVRDLRSSRDLPLPEHFAQLPIGLGSVEFARYFRDHAPFDHILNLSAMKQVRSEKDVYSLMRMLDTNVLFLEEFLARLSTPCRNFFSVSSDKAVRPASLMGATKTLMERVLLRASDRQPFATARFPNVAFSKGSLPFGFLQRIEKGQPLAAPRDVRRYFISHQEAAQLCLLACLLGDNGDTFFPKLEEASATTFSEIAARLLRALDYEPYECASAEEARRRVDELARAGKWPCYFSDSDTTGEKAYEEFHGDGERVRLDRFRAVGVLRRAPEAASWDDLEEFLAFARDAKARPSVTKEEYVEAMRKAVPGFTHVETGRSLDDKM